MRAIITGPQPPHGQQGYIRVNRVASASPINSFAFPGLRREWEWEGGRGKGGGGCALQSTEPSVLQRVV